MTEVWSEDGERKDCKCGKTTWSAAIAGEHDKNRDGSRLVSVDAITIIYAKLRQPAACFSAAAVTRYPNVGYPSHKTALVTPTITPLNFRNAFLHRCRS